MFSVKDILQKYSFLRITLRSFFVLVVLFLLFFAVNLLVLMNKKESAYNNLAAEKSKVMLQDTRLHNWDEIEERKK